MPTTTLLALAKDRKAGKIRGIPSICSAHPIVIAAALSVGRASQSPVLIEATCNQVNHQGGYTGMTPADFGQFVLRIAAQEQFDPARLILGGDHLGPNPWTHLSASLAMENAGNMVAAYAKAGFTKIHLDASMACADDPVPLPDTVIATRNAQLAAVAEHNAGATKPVYVIGTEVPVPGGAWEAVEGLVATSPKAAMATVALHQQAFAAEGIADAFARVVGLVVQPGVEFGNENVVAYDRATAGALVGCLPELSMLFEAHSTDYQTPHALACLVQDGFGILKVGPGLTFALREALYGLDHIADLLCANRPASLRAQMETLMLDQPQHWSKYYHGTPAHQQLQRHFSYSDRIRYYWAAPAAAAATTALMNDLGNMSIPEPLIAQYLGALYDAVMAKSVGTTAPELLRAAVLRVLQPYFTACRGNA